MNIDNKLVNIFDKLNNGLENCQQKFMQSNLYDIFNMALDTGIRIALPEIAENIVIDIKDSLLENGFKDGTKQIWDNLKEYGKSVLGIASGKFDSIEQVKLATKTGGTIDIISKIFDFALDKVVDNGKVSKGIKQKIKNQKNSIVKDIKSKISEDLDNQIKVVEKINDYNTKWYEQFEKKDLASMKNIYKNIQKNLNKILPLENIIKESRKIEILQNLVESTGNFDITEEERELANVLAY